MINFHQFIENIVDPKRNPKNRSYEKYDNDDDYELPSFDDDDDIGGNNDGTRTSLGLTAQYPLAKAYGQPKGFQLKSPKDLFKNNDAIADKLQGKDMLDTLRSKLRAGDKMTMREINVLIKLLNKEDEKLRRKH